jgi:hypothetical protein
VGRAGSSEVKWERHSKQRWGYTRHQEIGNGGSSTLTSSAPRNGIENENEQAQIRKGGVKPAIGAPITAPKKPVEIQISQQQT